MSAENEDYQHRIEEDVGPSIEDRVKSIRHIGDRLSQHSGRPPSIDTTEVSVGAVRYWGCVILDAADLIEKLATRIRELKQDTDVLTEALTSKEYELGLMDQRLQAEKAYSRHLEIQLGKRVNTNG